MAPSKELDTVLEMIRKRSAEVRKTTDDDRLSYERIMSVLPLDDDIETERVGVNGLPAEWISAPESQENRVVLYLHGGGYLFGLGPHPPGHAGPHGQGGQGKGAGA